MSKPTTHSILSRWPDRRAVHEDAQVANPSLEMVAVHRWHSRESIPAAYWSALVGGAKKRGFSVTLEELAEAHTPRIEAAE